MPPPTLKDSRVRKGTVYHYTSSAGMLGILEETPTLRLTNVKFLNDSEELVYGINLAKSVLKEVHKELAPAKVQGLLHQPTVVEDSRYVGGAFELVDLWLDTLTELAPFYTASFCQDGDNLRQWMSYCSGGGYAIGFDRALLQKVMINKETTLFKDVDYSEESLILKNRLEKIRQASLGYSKLITSLLCEKQIDDPAKHTAYKRYFKHFMALAISVSKLALCHKNKCFYDETESRLIFSSAKPVDDYDMFKEGVKFYPKGSLLIPFVEASFPKEAITEVRIGPMPNQKLACHSIGILQKRYGYSFDVLTSDMSLRPLS